MKDINNFSYSRKLMNIINYNVLALGTVTADKDSWSFLNFRPNFSKLYFMRKGELCITLKDDGHHTEQTYTLYPGFFYFIPANHTYDFFTNVSFDKFFIHLAVPLVDGRDLFANVKGIRKFPYEISELEHLISQMETSSLGSLPLLRTYIDSFYYKIMDLERNAIHERLTSLMGISDLCQNVLDYINNNISIALKISDIAKLFSISNNSLSAKFKKEVGLSLRNYLHQRIIGKSQSILLETDCSIKELSFQLGFSDPYNFSRFYKSITGLSPSEYRKEFADYYFYAKKY